MRAKAATQGARSSELCLARTEKRGRRRCDMRDLQHGRGLWDRSRGTEDTHGATDGVANGTAPSSQGGYAGTWLNKTEVAAFIEASKEGTWLHENPAALASLGVAAFLLLLYMLLRQHAAARQRRGHTEMCFGFFNIEVRPPTPPRAVAPDVPADVELVEQSTLQAIELLPSSTWDATGDEDNCAVCWEAFRPGDPFMRLPLCGHVFHKKCLMRWLVEAQRHKKRRCPLCNTDPLAPESAASPISSAPPAASPMSLPPSPPELPPPPAAAPTAGPRGAPAAAAAPPRFGFQTRAAKSSRGPRTAHANTSPVVV